MARFLLAEGDPVNGTQYEMVRRAVPAYKEAKVALEGAKHAPKAPGSSKALNDAQTAYDSAKTTFDTAYNTYANHMRANSLTPRDAADFLK